MDFIAVLDYEHLDNGMFLTAFARSLARKKSRGIILHGDSEYTERLIQTGMMREDATLRSIKDLNHRLIALFADQGVSTIGVNGYQKSLITADEDKITVDEIQLNKFPEQPMLLISCLAFQTAGSRPVPVSLPSLSLFLKKKLGLAKVTIFSTNQSSGVIKDDLPKKITPSDTDQEFKNQFIPKSFHHVKEDVWLTTADEFGN